MGGTYVGEDGIYDPWLCAPGDGPVGGAYDPSPAAPYAAAPPPPPSGISLPCPCPCPNIPPTFPISPPPGFPCPCCACAPGNQCESGAHTSPSDGIRVFSWFRTAFLDSRWMIWCRRWPSLSAQSRMHCNISRCILEFEVWKSGWKLQRKQMLASEGDRPASRSWLTGTGESLQWYYEH